MAMEQRLLIVDADSGAIIREIDSEDRIVSKRSVDAYVRMKRLQMENLDNGNAVSMKYTSFTFVNTEELQCLLKERMLDSNELALLFSIQPYIDYQSCAVLNTSGDVATMEDISDNCGFSRRKTSDVLKSLVSKHLLAKAYSGKYIMYFVNPWISRKGQTVNSTLIDMFGKYKVMSKGGVEWKRLLKRRKHLSP